LSREIDEEVAVEKGSGLHEAKRRELEALFRKHGHRDFKWLIEPLFDYSQAMNHYAFLMVA
jgi:hypothetical protein